LILGHLKTTANRNFHNLFTIALYTFSLEFEDNRKRIHGVAGERLTPFGGKSSNSANDPTVTGSEGNFRKITVGSLCFGALGILGLLAA